MKKFLCLMLVGLVCAGALAGCAAKEDVVDVFCRFSPDQLFITLRLGDAILCADDEIEVEALASFRDSSEASLSERKFFIIETSRNKNKKLDAIFLESVLEFYNYEIDPQRTTKDIVEIKITILICKMLRTIIINHDQPYEFSVVSNQNVAL